MEIQYIYYWYHHMMPSKEKEKIEKALNEKNYFDFINLYKKYAVKAIELGEYVEEFQSWCPMIFLPHQISIWVENKHKGYLSILDKESFEKITYCECECG